MRNGCCALHTIVLIGCVIGKEIEANRDAVAVCP